MSIILTAAIGAVLLVTAPRWSVSGTVAQDATPVVRVAEEERRIAEILALADELRTAILRKDIETIIKHVEVNPNHFVSHEEARRVLQDRTSPAHCLLFNTQCRRDQLWEKGGDGNPYDTSAREFFEKNRQLSVKVRFYGVGARRLDLAQIMYIVRGSSYDDPRLKWANEPLYWREWGKKYIDACVQRSGDRWIYHSGSGGVFFCKDD